ncbi:MAG: GAF domain-containing protein, partial [Chloroflexota bacterium]|nr:GAF domain-containing protein [Chloroflexota bacterium]
MGDTQPDGEASLQQTDRLRTLNEIGRVVSSTLDLGSLYETIYQQVSRVMDATQFYIAVQIAGSRRVELPYHREGGNLILNQQRPTVASVTMLVLDRSIAISFRNHQEYQEFVRRNGMPELSVGRELSEAKVWVPLNTGNRTIGVLSAQSPHPDAYSFDDVQTLSVIASQAAVAIENARLYAKSQDNVRQMQALLHAAQTINSSLDLQTVLD